MDRATLVAVPIMIVTIALGRPSYGLLWIGLGSAVFAAIAMLAHRKVRWRGGAYAVVSLGSAISALWTIGPVTGVGIVFGIAILLAGAFLSRRALIGVLIISAVCTFSHLGFVDPASADLEISFSLWFATAMAIAILAWVAMQFLRALIATLERSSSEAAAAYQLELATREQLDQSRQELEELARVEMVGRLAGGVAHDINNALAAIIVATEALAEEVGTPSQRRDLAELEAAALHAGDLVRDLLWTGRKFPSSTAAVANLGTVMRSCIERVGRVARTCEIIDDLDHAWQLAVAPEHLEQILFGLIVNLDRRGVERLLVSNARSDGWLEIHLEGTLGAIGTAGREIQVELGVSAARELVASYGGTQVVTELESQILIALRLPLAATAADRTVLRSGEGRTALVVEDEPMVLRRLCKLVAQRGYDVKSASSVADAIRLLEGRPDLLITDMQLPDGSGRDIALAAFSQDPARPIIVCSGFTNDDIRAGALQHAPLQFLPKPFTNASFEAILPTRSA
ncbi:MAG TPA: response regulator [Kofleriaceae bacterium]